MKGKFITFEGIDGSGKSTQIDLLKKLLDIKNIPFEVFREPGGTKFSEKIREILLDSKNIHLSSVAESLLFVAARSQLMIEKINPAIKEGKIVICDRFADSTVAYQGYGRGLNIKYLEDLNSFGTNEIIPDLTIILDINPDEAFRRKNSSTPDRMESIGIDFFIRVQKGYYNIASQYADRCVIIDGNRQAEIVFESVCKEINNKILRK